MFYNRKQAGILLGEALSRYKNQDELYVLGIPRGGVVPAYEVAKALHVPLNVVLVKKISHPTNAEYAIGAATINDFVITSQEDIPENYIREEVQKVQERIKEQFEKYAVVKNPAEFKNKTVIIVDDGIATGITLLMVINVLRKSKVKNIIVAVPVCPSDKLNQINELADRVICLELANDFNSVGEYYIDFEQVEDETVIYLLKKSQREY